jgi:hypothetical protein
MNFSGYAPNYLFSYNATVRVPPEVIGPVPEGIRANFYVTGGEMSGPMIRGTVLPVGADWLVIRRDGVGVLDVRVTMQTHDGALIYAPIMGVADLGSGGYDKFLQGNLPAKIAIRAAPRFQTAHPNYLWLNRLQCLNVGEIDTATGIVKYDVYST